MDQKKIEDLRKDYQSKTLDVSMVKRHPIEQFKGWFGEALEVMGSREPNAMTLATATKEGMPSARIILLKGVSEKGFVFYTNYDSQKGKELIDNPNAALVFFWPQLERQVRIEGTVTKLRREDSEKYFQSRPKGSQIGAHASPQSAIIANRSLLESNVEALERTYKNAAVLPCPAHWGGFLLSPKHIEFWQGRSSRLHDRIKYSLDEVGGWTLVRLAP